MSQNSNEFSESVQKENNLMIIPIDENSKTEDTVPTQTKGSKRKTRLTLDTKATPKNNNVESKASEILGPKSALMHGQQRTRKYGRLRGTSADQQPKRRI
jgi:hypothetical protein